MRPGHYEYSDLPLTARSHCKRISQYVADTFSGYRTPDPEVVAALFRDHLKHSIIRQTGSSHHIGLHEVMGSVQVIVEFNVLRILMGPNALEKLDRILGTSSLQAIQDIHES